MEILGKIFGSPARVKIMRLFLLNRRKVFSRKEVVFRSRVNSEIAGRELKLLHSVGFIKKHSDTWQFNPLFKYGAELDRILISSDTLDKKTVAESFKKVGRVKLLLLSGVFIKNDDSTVDLLIVGDKMKKGRIDDEIKKLEAEVGRELTYAIFETKEFIYRLNMYDKLVRDILDFPHEIVLQGKELSTELLKKA